MSAQLLHHDAQRRQRAVEFLRIDAVGLFALRERLLEDVHGGVRGAVAERLARLGRARVEALADAGGPSPAQLQGWLAEALDDPLETVRERCCRALARHGEAGPGEALRIRGQLERIVREDPGWRVRRAGVRALAAVWGAGVLTPLLEALDDPFWRVRHAVVQTLELLAEGEALRAEILRRGQDLPDTSRAALAYLAGGWPEGEAEQPERLGYIPAPGVGLELGDPDPAVVTARLMAADTVEVRGLIRMLPESHGPLRDEAARRLARVEQVETLWPALAWLERPRVPHAAAEVGRLLARLGARAYPLAAQMLAEGGQSRPRGEVWALGFVAMHAAEALHPAVFARCASHDPRLRAAALAALSQLRERGPLPGFEAAVAAGLADADAGVREAAAWASLCSARSLAPEHDALLGPAGRQRALELDPEPTRVLAGLADDHWRVRAAATLLAAPEDDALRRAALHDPDPVVAAAALDLDGACTLLLAEGPEVPASQDPSTRRRAARIAVRGRRALADAQRERVQSRLARADDPWLRARAADLVWAHSCSAAQLCRLLDASCDSAAMVRVSATASLDELARRSEGAGLGGRLLELLGRELPELKPSTRRAAWSRLIVELAPEQALARLDAGLAARTIDDELRAHLDALCVALGRAPRLGDAVGDALRERTRAHEPTQPRAPRSSCVPPAQVERRALGRTGIELAPLVLSGANAPREASFAAAAAAGVDTVFWEPRHHAGTRFLRQRGRGMQVIAGSFHADRRSIEADVETACRLLRRECIDLFLLFWVRSPARLSAEALACLRDLQARGRIRSFGFSTHDRALACAAIETGDWPVIMVRHSAAHPGAELELMPLAHAAGVGLLGFSALCYGRMLQPSSALTQGPSAPDCYRYSLSQAGVAACISAPRRARELRENLEVLTHSRLDTQALERLRAHGREVHGDNARFNRLVRRGGAGPLREAILQLFERCAEPGEASSANAADHAGEGD